MRVLGIDPGYGRCGFGVIQRSDRRWSCVTHGVITTDAGMDFEMRLLELRRDLVEIFDLYEPRRMVIEALFFAKSTTTALKVAEARGVILMTAAERGVEVVEVKPNEVKLALTGYGRAEKRQMQEMVKTVFDLKEVPKPDDAADALAVAYAGAERRRY